jgi:hypothetical protein
VAPPPNNAEWCDLVCRLHGVPTAVEGGLWVARRRPPPLYPDAVTLRGGMSAAAVAAAVGDADEVSVKDSYADLGLAPYGFEVLFSARWIRREPPRMRAAAAGWAVVDGRDELAEWCAAHGSAETFGPGILEDPSVAFVAARHGDDGRVLGGAIANRSAEVVGVSNVFTGPLPAAAAWADIARVVGSRFPGVPLVGYERGADLAAALAGGFADVAPLRVWVRRPGRPGARSRRDRRGAPPGSG